MKLLRIGRLDRRLSRCLAAGLLLLVFLRLSANSSLWEDFQSVAVAIPGLLGRCRIGLFSGWGLFLSVTSRFYLSVRHIYVRRSNFVCAKLISLSDRICLLDIPLVSARFIDELVPESKSVRFPNTPKPCKSGRRRLQIRVGSYGLKRPRSIPMASLSRPLIGIRWRACPRISKLELESLISHHLSCPDQMLQSSDLSNALWLLCNLKYPPPTPKLAQSLHVTCAAASSGSLFCGSVDDDRDAL